MKQMVILFTIVNLLLFVSCGSEEKGKEMNEKRYNSQMLENFKKKFSPHKLPNTLIELIKFDDNLKENSYYSQSFYLNDDIEENFFESWLDNGETDEKKRQEYAKSMIIFANADGTGGSYAMWIEEGNSDLEKAPIISYGSEGEVTVVANHLKDLIKILSFGAEGMEGSFYHYLDGDDFEEDPTSFYKDFVEKRPNFLKFRKWMKEVLHITPIDIECLKAGECDRSDEIEILVEKAHKKYNKVFDKWQYQFYPNPAEEIKKYQEREKVRYETKKTELLAKIANKPTVTDYLALAENENLSLDVKRRKHILYYQKALALEPNNIEVIERLAKKNRYSNEKEAIKYYLKLLELSDTPERYYSDIAYLYKNSKDYTKSLDFYIKDILKNPNAYGDYSQKYIVDICENLKNKDAITILEETVQKVPNANSYKILYKLYFKKKKYKIASQNAVNYIVHSDKQAHNYMDIADRFLKKEAYQEALPILEKTIERHQWDDRKMQTYIDIALCYVMQKEYKKALQYYEKALALNPDNEMNKQHVEEIKLKMMHSIL